MSDTTTEMVQICSHRGGREQGWIPRSVLEAMGIDCSPRDRRVAPDRQGCIWFDTRQSAAIRAHREWEPVGGQEQPNR